MKRRTVLSQVRVVVLLVLLSLYIPPGFSKPPSHPPFLFCLLPEDPLNHEDDEDDEEDEGEQCHSSIEL